MYSAVTSLLLTSLLLVVTATVVFWAVVGVVAADRTGRSRGLGLLSGLLPVVGPALVLAVPSSAQRAPGERVRSLRSRVPSRLPVLGRPAGPVLTPPPGAPGSLWRDPTPLWGAPGPVGGGESLLPTPLVAAPPVWEPPLPPAAAPQPAPPARAEARRRRLRRPSLGVTLLGALGVPLLLAALFEPWLQVRITGVTSGGYTGFDHPATWLPLLAAVIGTAGAVVLQIPYPRGTWVVVGALAGTTAVLCGLEILLFSGAVRDVLATLGSSVEERAEIEAGNGALLLIAGGAAALLWAVFTLAAVRPEENP